jgi:CubicO group peptidase (beta-lactamase class C family)
MRDGKPMTVKTKSWMASITKPMSASLMMMLIDDGRLTLDDRLSELLPPLRPYAGSRPITIRHLYTHTHGLDPWLKPNDDLADFEERVVDCRPFVRPGRTWNYNGTGYVLGGKVIEALTGEAIPEFYRRHLLEPLGCEDTDVAGTHGDMWSVPLDIARFGQMLLNEGSYGDRRYFSEATFCQMLPSRLTRVLGPDAKKVFGIGLDGNEHQFGHGAASAATFQINRDDELVVVMTRNAMGKNYDKYNGRFWDAIKAGILR